MKRDLDTHMQNANLDALLVIGGSSHNPAMAYFAGEADLTQGYLVKRRGQQPVLFHSSMERQEAARSGLPTRDLSDFDYPRLFEQAKGDRLEADAQLLKRLLQACQVRGRVAIYGQIELGPHFAALRRLEALMPEVSFVGESQWDSALMHARATKDEWEIERIRKMGRITVGVVSDVASFLTSLQAKDGRLVDRQGEVVTIGQVKQRINMWLAMRGADNPEGTIFAIGSEAGVPHSRGDDDAPIEVGKTIVFDLFPQEAGGGYFYDFTRTWCLGYAPEEVQQVYEDVRAVYEKVIASMQAGSLCRELQVMACELFQARGHPTLLSDAKTREGYVHSLGHGLGLNVHESPLFQHAESNQHRLQPGSVVAVEPGLYYPSRGLGVRIEDTVWIRPDGKPERLADFPQDLVLPVAGA